MTGYCKQPSSPDHFCGPAPAAAACRTYLGIQLMKVLLASPVSKPILCVCYTNHALDQVREVCCSTQGCAAGTACSAAAEQVGRM